MIGESIDVMLGEQPSPLKFLGGNLLGLGGIGGPSMGGPSLGSIIPGGGQPGTGGPWSERPLGGINVGGVSGSGQVGGGLVFSALPQLAAAGGIIIDVAEGAGAVTVCVGGGCEVAGVAIGVG
jgi:hypothetical protein